MWGKIENERLVVCQNIEFPSGEVICNPTPETYKANGYKKVTKQMPELGINQTIIESFTETDSEITVNFQVIDN